jgi:dynein light chain 1, axonemal
VLFTGNPIYEGVSREEQRTEMLTRVPQLTKIDGEIVTPAERELALGGGSTAA